MGDDNNLGVGDRPTEIYYTAQTANNGTVNC
jgi:hypothetical protein